MYILGGSRWWLKYLCPCSPTCFQINRENGEIRRTEFLRTVVPLWNRLWIMKTSRWLGVSLKNWKRKESHSEYWTRAGHHKHAAGTIRGLRQRWCKLVGGKKGNSVLVRWQIPRHQQVFTPIVEHLAKFPSGQWSVVPLVLMESVPITMNMQLHFQNKPCCQDCCRSHCFLCVNVTSFHPLLLPSTFLHSL